jgi:rare lipoprotein A
MKFKYYFIKRCSLILILLFTFVYQLSAQAKPVKKAATKERHTKAGVVLYGQASFYANKFHGRLTANGEIFSQKKMTAACNSLPLGTWIRVTNLRNGKSIIVKTNDRLNKKTRRLVDLTRTAAQKLGFISRGLTRVKVEVLNQKAYKRANRTN